MCSSDLLAQVLRPVPDVVVPVPAMPGESRPSAVLVLLTDVGNGPEMLLTRRSWEMRNHRGELAECSQSNLFVVSGGVVRTPPLEAGLLAGITRQLVLELCREAHLPAEEVTLHDGDLLEADEAFITSSTREIVPVVRVDHTVVADGRPGRITARLLDAFRARVDSLCPAPTQASH